MTTLNALPPPKIHAADTARRIAGGWAGTYQEDRIMGNWMMANNEHYADYLERRADYVRGIPQPDPRDDELRDRGVEIEWRANVQRRVSAHGNDD